MNLSRIAEIEEQLNRGTLPDVETLRALIARARLTFAVPAPPAPKKPPVSGMSPAERQALCEALTQREVASRWHPYQKHTQGAKFGVSGGGGHAVHRDAEGNATYITLRHDASAEWPLGKFVGKNWIVRLADAVEAKFCELNPVNCGWVVGQRARTKDGREFTVSRIIDHRGGTRRHGGSEREQVFIDLFEGDDGYTSHNASECTRIDEV